MHWLFLALVPGGAPVKKAASQHKALLATVRPPLRTADLARRRRAAQSARRDWTSGLPLCQIADSTPPSAASLFA
jgi:hypothetical protein